jgi:hypothetical protein
MKTRAMIFAKSKTKNILTQLYCISSEAITEIAEDGTIMVNELEALLTEVEDIMFVGFPWEFESIWTVIRKLGFEGKVITPNEPNRLHEKMAQYGLKFTAKDFAYRSIYNDLWHRDWYAFPLIAAVAQAERLGLKELTVVEMGVWMGEGLLNMASLCVLLTECTGIRFRVIGFDAGSGLPSVADYRDHPELWYTGELAAPDIDRLRSQLPKNCELIIGDIANTINGLISVLTPASPLAFMALDVDTYSSSVSALRVFKEIDASCMLPATPIYVDDGYINIMQNEYCGEGLAIREFNEEVPLRKILQKIVRTQQLQKPWHHTIYFCHAFDHPVRASHQGVSFIGLNINKL